MPTFHYPTTIKYLSIFPCLLIAILSSGCVTSPSNQSFGGQEAHSCPSVPNDWVPFTRYGRYTLVELAPQAAQHNLLLQMVEVFIPATPQPTVEDGLRSVLEHSGYSLCDNAPDSVPLYAFPLPAAHLRLGPILLYDALLTLAGPAWELQVDDRARQVCFTSRLKDTAERVKPESASVPASCSKGLP